MSARLHLSRIGPLCSIQDMGRPGNLHLGLSRGGAADTRALYEAAALLGSKTVLPAIEMAGAGGTFEASAPIRFALTGAPMTAHIDTDPLRWNATHLLHPGEKLVIGGCLAGVYGYLSFAGGIACEPWLGSCSVNFMAGIGRALEAGQVLEIGADPDPGAPQMALPDEMRFSGGSVRLMPGPQTRLFAPEILSRFLETEFTRTGHANRQGLRLHHEGAPFSCAAAHGLASDFVTPGDVQMTGEGIPFVLLSECQSMGGYPRIGTVIEQDLPRISQAPAGAAIRFSAITVEAADKLNIGDATEIAGLRGKVHPLVRDPHTIRDLLSYQLVSGVTRGDDI